MADRKKAKKPLAKKAMKKTKGGAVDYFLKLRGVDGDVTVAPTDQYSLNFTKIQF